MENHETRLYSYKMTHVTGKAPRVYENELVLPDCKTHLRDYIRPGSWIAGWTSKSLKRYKNSKQYATEAGQERLIYLALVDSKISPSEYNAQYKGKPTCVPIEGKKACCNEGCPPKEICTDEAPVLICKEFYYFGLPGVPIDKHRPEVGDRGERKTLGKQADLFINDVRQYAAECKTAKS